MKTCGKVCGYLLVGRNKLNEGNVNGKEISMEKEEVVFFLGNVRCVLSDKGWQFESFDRSPLSNH